MDIVQDIRDHSPELLASGNDASDLLAAYLRTRDPHVMTRGRRVHVGSAIEPALRANAHVAEAVRLLSHAFETGSPLGAGLNARVAAPRHNESQGLDEMLAFLLHEWRVSHFVALPDHPSTTTGFADEAIILFMVTQDDVYIFGVCSAEDDLSSVAHALITSFPGAGLFRFFEGMKQNGDLRPAEREAVVAAGIDPRSIIHRPEGSYIFGTGGSPERTDTWNAAFRARAIIDAAEGLAAQLVRERDDVAADPNIRFVFLENDQFAVRDEARKVELVIPV